MVQTLFEKYTGSSPTSVEKLKGAGSNRSYFRLFGDNQTLIGVKGEAISENKAFIALSNHFVSKGICVPEVLAVSENSEYYLQEDLGDVSLFDAIAEGRKSGNFSGEEKTLLFKTISVLPDIQYKGAEGLDFSICYPQANFDMNTVLWDLNYFKYCFLKATGIDFLETKLENDFRKMAENLTKETTQTFLYRDFQSRNVMIKNGEPYFIDFQGGRKGAIYYDVASFVWQAKANFPETLRNELINCYLEAVKKYISIDAQKFRKTLIEFVLLRMLQTLGAYGFRGYFEQKKHFLESIPFAMENLQHLLNENNFDQYPYLAKLLKKMCENVINKHVTSFQKPVTCKANDTSKLTVTIYSFSYKKGIPEDVSGNGGGYVFDCRGIYNPGRYDEFKTLTGLDKPVIDFLEEKGEITEFLNSVYRLANPHIENYLTRGFSNLMFCFGCTGGQHRSVYSAQRFAEYVRQKYDVKVVLNHRELSEP